MLKLEIINIASSISIYPIQKGGGGGEGKNIYITYRRYSYSLAPNLNINGKPWTR